MRTVIEIPLAGHSRGKLVCDSVHCECGGIEDGIGFCFPGEGGWVMSFEDLEQLYFTVRKLRKKSL